MKLRITILLFLTTFLGFSQKSEQDSLWNVWKDVKQSDTSRLNAIYDFAWNGYLFNKPDSAYYYSTFMMDFAIAKKQKKYEAKANNLQGTYFYNIGDYAKSMESHKRSLFLMKEIDDKKGIASALSNIGVLYKIQGDFTTAIDYYTQGLKIKEGLGDKKGIAISYNNIGNIYSNLGDYKHAIDYFNKGLVIWEELKDKKGISGSLNNIGMIYFGNKDNVKALDNYTRSLKIREETDDKPGVAKSLGSIGSLYFSEKEYGKAIENYSRALKINEEIGDKQGIANANANIGGIYLIQNDYSKAISYSNKGLLIAQKIGAILEVQAASENLYIAFKKIGKGKEALEMHELFIQMRDSINSETSKKEVVKQEFKYQYEKKTAADSVKASEEKKVVDAQFHQAQTQRYVLYIGIALLIVFAGFMFNRFRATQKQKIIIEQQKQIVEMKQREVLDSIHYAKRIQQSLLPTEKYIYRSFKRLSKFDEI